MTDDTSARARTALVLTIDPDDAAPWERQPGETERQYEFFIAYRDQEGKRGYEALARTLRVSGQRLREVSLRNRWPERCLAWDRMRQQRRDAAKAEADRRLEQRHGGAANALYQMAMRGMLPQPLLGPNDQALIDRDGQPIYRPPTLRELAGAATVLDKAIHHERLAAGLPTDITRQDVLVRQEVQRVNSMVEAMLRILEETLCDECRDAVLTQMDFMARQAGE